ncbi:hypothetical protein [Photorhabdus kayaii]|uniref:hypothetical protein n=1 Tax=Photorhabdus kayaii TaxID=230088 RepID=UPI0021D4B63F|nr:hypothetical protein [Photorhabdus kayaii]MCT8351304.1 hypothetical protein [Photorhabdus kayaii]
MITYIRWISRCIATARERIPGSIDSSVTGVSVANKEATWKMTGIGNFILPVNGQEVFWIDLKINMVNYILELNIFSLL